MSNCLPDEKCKPKGETGYKGKNLSGRLPGESRRRRYGCADRRRSGGGTVVIVLLFLAVLAVGFTAANSLWGGALNGKGMAQGGGNAAWATQASAEAVETGTENSAEFNDKNGDGAANEPENSTGSGADMAGTVQGAGKTQIVISNQDGGLFADGEKPVSKEIDSDGQGGTAVAGTDAGSGGAEAAVSAENPLRLLFAGDVYLSSHVLNAYDQAGGIGGVLDAGYREAIAQADYFAANEEFPFSDRGTAAEDKQYTFRLPPGRAHIMGELGLDAVTLANNHALDFGTDALLDTVETLDQEGIAHTGAGKDLEAAGKPVIAERRGKKIGLIGASRVVPLASWGAGKDSPGMLLAYDPERLLELIRSARAETDLLIIYLHWGVEREEQPRDYQRTLGQACIDAGADLVIGAHPHVLQGIEYYQGKPIVYSLGNFVFGSSIPRTALLEVCWDGKETALRLLPGTSGAGYTRMLTDSGKKEEFYTYMEGISDGIQIDGAGWVHPE